MAVSAGQEGEDRQPVLYSDAVVLRHHFQCHIFRRIVIGYVPEKSTCADNQRQQYDPGSQPAFSVSPLFFFHLRIPFACSTTCW